MKMAPRLWALLALMTFVSIRGMAQSADFSASKTAICAAELVQFTDRSVSSVTAWSWDLGNGVTSNSQNPSTTYSTPGSYSVKLVVNFPGGSDSLIKTAFITVYDKPAVTFSALLLAGCAPLATSFSSVVTPNAPGPLSYVWSFGDGLTDTAAAPPHTFTTPNTYTVSVTVRNGVGCPNLAVNNSYITVHPIPVPSFSPDATHVCSAAAIITFSNTSYGSTLPFTYNWGFGDNTGSTAYSPSHQYGSTGVYTVGLSVTDTHGCKDSATYPTPVTVVGTLPTFTAPAAACPGDSVLFTNTTPGATGTGWDFGDGFTDTGATNSHTHPYFIPGIYTITMRTTIDGCPKDISRTLLINPKPVAHITMTPSIPCQAPVTVSFIASPPAMARYDWAWRTGSEFMPPPWGSAGIDSGQSVSRFYTINTWENVRLIITSPVGCMDTAVMDTMYIREIFTNIQPSGDFVPEPDPEVCVHSAMIFSTDPLGSWPPHGPGPPSTYPVPATSWTWDFGRHPNDVSTLPYPNAAFDTLGTFTIRCIITTANGCVDTGYRHVHTDTPVHPDFVIIPQVVCPNYSQTFINTTAKPLPGTSYLWNIYDPHKVIDTAVDGVVRFDTTLFQRRIRIPGTYTITLTTIHRGCPDSLIKTAYVTVNAPAARFDDSIYCSPSTTVRFTNHSYGATSQLWQFGDGVTDTSLNPVHTYAALGTYIAQLITYDNVFGCSDTFRRSVVIAHPLISFGVNDTSACADQTLRFQGSYTGADTPVLYSWQLDALRTPLSPQDYYEYIFGTRGYHDVTLFIQHGDNKCVDSFRIPGFVKTALPDVNFGAYPPAQCDPLPIVFRDSSTNTPGVPNVYYHWNFGDADTVTTLNRNVSHKYGTLDSFKIILTVTDSFGCRNTFYRDKYVSLHKPVAAFSRQSDSGCIATLLHFTSASSSLSTGPKPFTQRWYFGDGGTDTGANPAHAYAVAGNYPVRLIVTDVVGCSDTANSPRPIKISAPHAAFSASPTVGIPCPALQVFFTNNSTGASAYTWNFGTGTGLSVAANPVNTYTSAGLYHVILVAKNPTGCTDTARDSIRVLGYNGAFTYTPATGCAPLDVQFSATLGNVPQVIWDFKDGSTKTTTTASTPHTYIRPGIYFPVVIFSDGQGCSAVSTALTPIKVDQVFAGFNWTTPCAGTPFSLRDSSTAVYGAPVSWQWRFGGGNTASGATPSYTFTTPGNHPVQLVITNGIGCKDSVVKDVYINPLPPVNAGPDIGICPDAKGLLTATGAKTYTWSPASLADNPGSAATLVSLRPGADTTLFTVTGIDTNGCINTDEAKAYIQIVTTGTVGAGGAICVGDTFRLHAEGAQTYSWSPAATLDNPAIASPLAKPEATTTYIVTAKESTCLERHDTVTVIVHPLPQFSAGNDELINLGSAVILQPTQSGITRIEWKADTSLSCKDCFRPVASPLYTTTYYAKGYTEYGCVDSDSVTVRVRCNGSLVFIPNTFTPNNDGNNDFFFPRGKGVARMTAVRVYNRWGEVVFEKLNMALNDEKSGWDGTFNGKALPPDTYVYTMQSHCDTGEPVTWKGDITLIR